MPRNCDGCRRGGFCRCTMAGSKHIERSSSFRRVAHRGGRVVSECQGTATAAVAAVFAAAPWLAASILNAPHLSAELRIAAGVLFLNAKELRRLPSRRFLPLHHGWQQAY